MQLRYWQQEALSDYLNPQDGKPHSNYTVTATPGAGKTTFALTAAKYLLQQRTIDQIIIVVPTDHLRTQWAEAATRFGMHLDHTATNQDRLREDIQGYVTTYAQVASKPAIHHNRVEHKSRTLVIFDEIHHTADGTSWGDAIQYAFDHAYRRLILTGTPYRTSTLERIPYITYRKQHDDTYLSEANYTYSYRHALQDNVVRPVMFAAYSGVARWRDSMGDLIAADLNNTETLQEEQAAWKTVLNPKGQWVADVIKAAHDRVTELRATTTPDAGCLILASDQETAKQYAAIIKKITKNNPTVVISDDPKASAKIDAYNNDPTQIYLVAVRMVSEGVDVQRLSCLIWLTNYQTPLFFAQAVGRVVRSRNPNETATVFLPAVKPLLELAANLEQERDHVLRPDPNSDTEDTSEKPERKEREYTGENIIDPVDSQARFQHVVFAGQTITPAKTTQTTAETPNQHNNTPNTLFDDPYSHLDPEEANLLGIPGMLSDDQAAILLAQHRAQNLTNTQRTNPAEEAKALRKEISTLAAKWSIKSGISIPQAHINTRNAVPGPKNAEAPLPILKERRDFLLGKTT